MKEFDLEKFPFSESAKEMLHSASEDFYEKSYVFKWILEVMGLEWDKAKAIIADELAKQFFIETATWGLRYHEEKWGIPVREYLSYEERRRLLYERRDFKSPMTPYAMEQYIKNTVSCIDVRVMDCHDSGGEDYQPEHPNVFKVVLVPDRTDIKAVHSVIRKIKQSHTTYVMECKKTYELQAKATLAGAVLKKTTVTVSADMNKVIPLKSKLVNGSVVASRTWRTIK